VKLGGGNGSIVKSSCRDCGQTEVRTGKKASCTESIKISSSLSEAATYHNICNLPM
jgi:hypothetical protein